MSSSTPTKSTNLEDVASPSAKRALDFDFWTERKAKVPRVIQEDLKVVKIKELNVTKRSEGRLTLRCSAIFNLPNVFKLACDDGENKITVTSFKSSSDKLRSVAIGSFFNLTNFQVKLEKEEYRTGSYEGLEIILSDFSVAVPTTDANFPSYPFDFKTVAEIKEMPDSSIVDILAIVAKDWGVTTTSSGKRKLDVSLTDKTMQTVRFTLWDNEVDQLVGSEGKIVAIGRAAVSSYLDVKLLNAKWFTTIMVDPDRSDAKDLTSWFEEEMQK